MVTRRQTETSIETELQPGQRHKSKVHHFAMTYGKSKEALVSWEKSGTDQNKGKGQMDSLSQLR